MAKNKWWMVVIVLLLLVNTAVLAMLWFKKKPLPPRPGGDARAFLVKELNLSKTQQDTFDILKNDHRSQVSDIQEQIRANNDELFDLLAADRVDSAAINTLTSSIGEKEKQRDVITFYHFRKLRSTLNAQQQEKFDQTIRKGMRMAGPPGRPPGPMPGEDRPEHEPGEGDHHPPH